MSKQLLTPDEAADHLRVSEKTLRRMRSQGLPYIALTSGTIRYRAEDLNTFIDERTLQCHTARKARASGTTISKSGVVDFMEAVRPRITKKQNR